MRDSTGPAVTEQAVGPHRCPPPPKARVVSERSPRRPACPRQPSAPGGSGGAQCTAPLPSSGASPLRTHSRSRLRACPGHGVWVEPHSVWSSRPASPTPCRALRISCAVACPACRRVFRCVHIPCVTHPVVPGVVPPRLSGTALPASVRAQGRVAGTAVSLRHPAGHGTAGVW